MCTYFNKLELALSHLPFLQPAIAINKELDIVFPFFGLLVSRMGNKHCIERNYMIVMFAEMKVFAHSNSDQFSCWNTVGWIVESVK